MTYAASRCLRTLFNGMLNIKHHWKQLDYFALVVILIKENNTLVLIQSGQQ
jgi:hypothetical protein